MNSIGFNLNESNASDLRRYNMNTYSHANHSREHWPLVAINLLLSGYLIWRIRFHASLIHINLRIVLCYTYFTQYNLIALGRLADEANIWLVSDGCEDWFCILISNTICFVSKLLHDTGILLAANSDLLVLLERLAATLMPSSYESKNARIGNSIIILFYIGCFIIVSDIAFYDAFVNGFGIWQSNGSCQSAALHPNALVAFWCWAVGASYIGTFALLYLYRYNKKQMEHWLGSGKLTIRYQFGENVRTLRAILPAIMLNAIFFTIGLYFVISYLINGEYGYNIVSGRISEELDNTSAAHINTQTVSSSILISETFLFKLLYYFADVYGLIFAVIFILRSKSILKILLNDLIILFPCYRQYNYHTDKRSLELSGVRSSVQHSSHHHSPSSRVIKDNVIEKAKISDDYFKHLHKMWS